MIPTNTPIKVNAASGLPSGADVLAFFLPEAAKEVEGAALAPADVRDAVAGLIASGSATGKEATVAHQLVQMNAKQYAHVLVIGLGKADKASTESYRKAGGALLRTARRLEAKSVAAVPVAHGDVAMQAAAEAIATGMLLAGFDFRELKGELTKKQDREAKRKPDQVLKLTLAGQSTQQKLIRAGLKRAEAIASGQNFARTIATRPGNVINPPSLAKAAKQMAQDVGLGCQVMDEKELKKLGMGGILAVGAGSETTPPRLIILDHKPQGSAKQKPLLIVGKAITFDTGGISIKPSANMQEMIFDKCGGMTVLGVMAAVALLKLPVRVVGILSSAENHISAKAYRPGDVLTMYNKQTVEVTNTDAEGRLVLADALAWGIEKYKPQAVVDLATLTGGVIVALGKQTVGVMGNNDDLATEIINVGKETGEKMWQLPCGDDQRELLKSAWADMVNSGGREGHPLQGGAFLSNFVPEDVPWVHLDIAGPADIDKDWPYYGRGATGWGVRTLVEWIAAKA